MGPSQKRPADLDLASFRVVAVKPRRSNDLPTVDVDGDERTSGCQGLVKEGLEGLYFMAISHRMLFPDERIGSHSEKVVVVIGAKWPKFDKLTFQDRLIIE
jgi:hypothetical protein